MNTLDFTYLLNHSQAINEQQTIVLEGILINFPFFQSARALHLKGLFNQESFRYNYELKKTAANTFDRSILFEFITSNDFKTLPNNHLEEQTEIIENIVVNQVEEITQTNNPKEIVTISNENNKNSSTEIVNTESILNPEKFIELEEISTVQKQLAIGKPLSFENTEKYSFNEWLQLTQVKPIDRKKISSQPNKLDKKIDLIDKFIENNPKIAAVKENIPAPANIRKSIEEPTNLMTETLAQIYLEQKKYTRAIQAYEILILKYPEKSSFFANQIENIKKLQQNNN